MTKKKNDSDTDVQRYARLFDMLDAHLPISDAFEAEDPQKTKRWWASQRQHMGCYFAGRATRLGNWSAKEAYTDLQHAEGKLAIRLFVWPVMYCYVDFGSLSKSYGSHRATPTG